MKLELSLSLRRNHDSLTYANVHICDEEMQLYIFGRESDYCEAVPLTPSEARVLAEHLRIAADYFEANVLKPSEKAE